MGQLLSQGPLFIVCLVFMMGIVVIIHELGHFLVGRLFGAAVESFSVGFGRPIFERKDKVGTRWRVNWIPLGGFVKFVGESQLAGDVGKMEQGPVGKAYKSLTVWQRMLVSLAGPLANFVLASLIFALILGTHGRTNYSIGIADVVADSPAERGGMKAGDAFVSVNGHPVTDASSITIPIMLNPNEEMTFEVLRDGAPVALKVTPDEVVRENEFGQMVPQATIGIAMARIAVGERVKYNPVQALGAGVVETGATIDRTVTMLSRIVTGKMSVHTMTGPVGIGDISRRVVNKVWEQPDVSQTAKLEQLFWMLLSICAAISVGVGFFNLLPLPVLDGGHLVFHAYEAIAGRELPEKVQEMSLTFGLILLLGMVVVITWGDIMETGLFGGTGG
ncbi:M50 family metallopeptidase [Hyphomonas oceanitis]|uniref:M50 family peptidase n=1 Tax=Hyphomonas oceanitis SCH89 TaxID=1280953 RepID=A0A059G518_9PROT|nr:M50 family metallopeptidase [Hyphomonas oceanitis]KDA01578.1 M50 family peptidase [Hyphomonas oceanitis SCH89]